MNTATMARYYPAYLDMLRTKARQPERCLLTMLENVLRAEQLLAEPRRRYSVGLKDQNNPVQRFDHLGLVTDEVLREFVPARVANWVQVQLLALPACAGLGADLGVGQPRMGWLAYLHAHTPAPQGRPGQPVPVATQREASLHLTRQGSEAQLAPLTRGLHAHQAKRRKRARRLLAQLWTFHWQQCRPQPVAAEAEGRVAA